MSPAFTQGGSTPCGYPVARYPLTSSRQNFVLDVTEISGFVIHVIQGWPNLKFCDMFKVPQSYYVMTNEINMNLFNMITEGKTYCNIHYAIRRRF